MQQVYIYSQVVTLLIPRCQTIVVLDLLNHQWHWNQFAYSLSIVCTVICSTVAIHAVINHTIVYTVQGHM